MTSASDSQFVSEIGKRVVGGAKPVIVGVGDLRGHGLAALGETGLIHPEEPVFGNGVIFDESALMLDTGFARAGEFGGKLLLHGQPQAIDRRDQGRRRIRLCRPGAKRR